MLKLLLCIAWYYLKNIYLHSKQPRMTGFKQKKQ